MKNIRIILLLLLILAGSCAGPTKVPPPWPAVVTSGPAEGITVLPVRDSRSCPTTSQQQDVAAKWPLIIPLNEVMAIGEKVWQVDGPTLKFRSYPGPKLANPTWVWSDLPLSTLETDLGLAIELKAMDLKKKAPNALIVAHNLFDSALLPFYFGGMAVTDGHVDLAGRLLPSNRVKLTVVAQAAIISLKGGGPIFTKIYPVGLVDPAASDAAILKGWHPRPEDGQAYGRLGAPEVLTDFFTWLVRDPEMACIPRLARAAWLGRVIEDDRVPNKVKLRLIDEYTIDVAAPPLTPDELEILSDPYLTVEERLVTVTDPVRSVRLFPREIIPKLTDLVWIEEAKARFRLFALTYSSLLRAAGRLSREERIRPLDPNESAIKDKIAVKLAAWGREYPALNLYRADLKKPGTDWIEKKAIFLSLARNLEVLDNDDFLRLELAYRLMALCSRNPASRQEAAALLVAARGPAAFSEGWLDREQVFQVLTGEDVWARPLVLEALATGDFSPETVRLAGALGMAEAWPYLTQALENARSKPSLDNHLKPMKRPDPISVVRAMSGLKNQPEVNNTLKSILQRWRPGRDDALAAEAIISLGRLGDRTAVPEVIRILAEAWPGQKGSPLVRRAALNTLTSLAGPEVWSEVLALATARLEEAEQSGQKRQLVATKTLEDDPTALDQTADGFNGLGEAARSFGGRRHAPALPWLIRLVKLEARPDDIIQSAFTAISLMGSAEAEAELTQLLTSPRLSISRGAARALNQLARERALWRELERRPAGD